jgi:hypothetical protein
MHFCNEWMCKFFQKTSIIVIVTLQKFDWSEQEIIKRV